VSPAGYPAARKLVTLGGALKLQQIKLCRLDELPVGGSRGFDVELTDGLASIFLVRTRRGIFAYRNSCPHTGGPLDWVADQFLNLTGDLIQCATHGALFRPDDGACVSGPCAGRALQALPLQVIDAQIWLLPAATAGS